MPTKITGYRDLSEDELAIINSLKHLGTVIESQITEIVKRGADPGWAAIGRTDMQKGLMCLIRSVAKPESF